MIRRLLGKALGFVGYTIQYGCIAHCAFEYIGEIVVVRIITALTADYIFLKFHSVICAGMLTVIVLQCSGPSMEPTIVNSDVVFSERMSRHLCKIQKWVAALYHACSF